MTGADFFVTLDEDQLRRSNKVHARWGLEILRPCSLITLSDERIEEEKYKPVRLGGTQIRQQRLSAGDLDQVVKNFLRREKGELRKSFQAPIRTALAKPDEYESCVIRSPENTMLGFYLLDRTDSRHLRVPRMRIAKGSLVNTLSRQLAWRIVAVSAEENRPLTVVSDECLP